MIKSAFGDRLDGWLHRLLPWFFRQDLNPNTLTVIGTLVSLGAAACLAAGAFRLAGVIILAGGFFDLVDGVVARHRGTSSRFGAFLDSTLDRLVDMALFLGIAMHYAIAGAPEWVLLCSYTLVTSVLVSYAQAKAELCVPSFKIGLFERGERIVILALGALSGLLIPALAAIAVGNTVTVCQRFALAYREMERIDADERASVGGPT